MSSISIEIIPCPFCGSVDIDFQYGDTDREGTMCNVICADCGATGPWIYVDPNKFHKCEVVEQWNKRSK
jgi:Lar family restriction alleviation protein